MWPVHAQVTRQPLSDAARRVDLDGKKVMVKEGKMGDKIYGFQVTSVSEGLWHGVGRELLRDWGEGGGHNLLLVNCTNEHNAGLPRNLAQNVAGALSIVEQKGGSLTYTATLYDAESHVTDLLTYGKPQYKRGVLLKTPGVLQSTPVGSAEVLPTLIKHTQTGGLTMVAYTATYPTTPNTVNLIIVNISSPQPLFHLTPALSSITSGADGVTDYTAKSNPLPTVLHHYLVGKPCSRMLVLTLDGTSRGGMTPYCRLAQSLMADTYIAPKEVTMNTTLQEVLETHEVLPEEDFTEVGFTTPGEVTETTTPREAAWEVILGNAKTGEKRKVKGKVRKTASAGRRSVMVDGGLLEEIRELETTILQKDARLQTIEDTAIMVKQENLSVAENLRDAQQLNTKLNYDVRRLRADHLRLQEQHEATLRHLQDEVASRRRAETDLKLTKDRSIASLRDSVRKNVNSPLRERVGNTNGDLKLELIEVKKENMKLRKKIEGSGGKSMRQELEEHQKVLASLRVRVKGAEAEVVRQKEINLVLAEQKKAVESELDQTTTSRDRLFDALKGSSCCLRPGIHLLEAAASELLRRASPLPPSPTTDAVSALHTTILQLISQSAEPPDVSGLSRLPAAIHNEITQLHAMKDLLETAQSLHTNLLTVEGVN